MPDPIAVKLIELAEAVLHPKSVIVDFTGIDVPDYLPHRIKVALDFARLPAQTRFAAIVEEWDYQRIFAELY